MNLMEKAKHFAAKAHEGQLRKVTGTPMFQHAENVALTLLEAGFSEEVVAAGFLHDTVEDTDVTMAEIVQHFGKKVAFIVAGHTENKALSWEERKQHTIDELADPNTPIEIRALIIADRLDNLRSLVEDIKVLGDDLWKCFKRGKDKQAWYFRGSLENMAVGLEADEIPAFFYIYEKEVKDFFN